MYKLSTVSKPAEPTSMFNALISAKVLGDIHENGNFLSWADEKAFENPDAAYRGPNNLSYEVTPSMADLDPTCILAQAIEAANYRNPVGSVGYTHHHRALNTLSGLGSMFMSWVRSYNTLATVAATAQKDIKSGVRTQITDTRTIYKGAGDIEAFLMATGNIKGGVLAYPDKDEIDVNRVYNIVMNQLSLVLSPLDNEGCKIGEINSSRSVGIGTLPGIGEACAFLPANVIDSLYRSPWRHVFANPQVRDMMRDIIRDRLDFRNCGQASDAHYIAIAEGDDVLYIPSMTNAAALGSTITDMEAYLDKIFSLIDARNSLADSHYAKDRDSVWTDQFYTTGDLVKAIFVDRTLNPQTKGSRLNVLLGVPKLKTFDSVSLPTYGDVLGTGALASTQQIHADGSTSMNHIHGMIDYVQTNAGNADGQTALGGYVTLTEGRTDVGLPNGIMYLGDCATASATDWIEILRWLDRSLPTEVRMLLDKTGRAKRSLPKAATAKIASTDALLAEMISSGQRDGYLPKLSASFNVDRKTRVENEGPMIGSASPDASGNYAASPWIRYLGNGWNKTDDSAGLHVMDYLGNNYNLDASPGMFTGQFEAGRFSRWQHATIPASVGAGSSDVASVVADNLLSLPMKDTTIRSYVDDVNRDQFSVTTKHMVPEFKDLSAIITITNTLDTQTKLFNMSAATSDTTRWSSYHPELGFMRGLGSIFGAEGGKPTELEGQQTYAALSGQSTLGAAASPVFFAVGGANYLKCSTDGSGVLVGLSGTRKSVFRNTWFWDPTRAQITGRSWQQWAGIFFGNILPHPYATTPFYVPTSQMKLSEINTIGMETATERTIHAVKCVPLAQKSGTLHPTRGYESEPYVPLVNWPTNATLNGRIEEDYGSCNGLMVIGSMASNTSMLVGSYNAKVEDVYSGTHVSGASFNPVTASTVNLGIVPTFQATIGILNGCGRNPINRASAIGLNATNAAAIGSLAAPGTNPGDASNKDAPIPFMYQGENVVPVGDNFASIEGISIAHGPGLCPDEGMVAPTILDPIHWLAGVYNGAGTYRHSSMLQDVVGGSSKLTYSAMYVGAIGACQSGTLTDTLASKSRDMTSTFVENPWFARNGGFAPTNRRARDRDDKLKHPWVRGESESGMLSYKYDLSDVDFRFFKIKDNMRILGDALNSGLNNSLFLELQRAN